MEKYILIVAGGKGERMNDSMPKQFIEICGRPVLMHTFDAFISLLPDAQFILVLHQSLIKQWEELCKIHLFAIQHQLVIGGPMRFHSVKAGLKMVPDDALVAIHDGVRPLVSEQTINNCFLMAMRKGNAVPIINVDESVRMIENQFSTSIDRNKIRLVQTPQVFHSSLIKKAYQQNYQEKFTDDASVFERLGNSIFLVEGNRENIKITTQQDLVLAESLLTCRK